MLMQSQFWSNTCVVGLSLIFAINSFGQNPSNKSKKIGSVNSFLSSFGATNARGSRNITLTTTEGTVSATINLRKAENGKDEFIGNIVGMQSATVSFTFSKGAVDGFIVIPEKKLAYKYSTDKKGTAIVSDENIHNVMCIEYDEVKTSKNSKIDAALALPPSTSPVYKLQSLPGAVAVAYLDVDGEVVSRTRWAGGATINAQPMNLTETDITNIWKIVAEDFRAFNINITTDRSVFNAAPTNRRTMCILTTTNTAAPGAGGVAFLNSFNSTSDDPCWTFNTGAKTAGETSSHEIGHTLGLNHDGYPSSAYYPGHGSWAPIMGSSYQRPIGQWSRGEYTGANNQEDDLAIIGGTRNGFGFRADEAGNTISTAKALAVSPTGTVVAANNFGIISTRTDLDVYSFTTSGGNVSLSVTPFDFLPNLDVLLSLTNSSGVVVSTSNPTNTMSASITTNLPRGTYYLTVDGTGNGNPLNTGYSDYSSLGGYNIAGTVPVGGGSNVLPAISITSPLNNSSFTALAKIDLKVNATDVDGSVVKVDYFNGTTLIGTATSAPFDFTWNNVSSGTYTILARATDNAGGLATSSAIQVVVRQAILKNVPPTVSITTPTNNASFNAPANVGISANANDADGIVSKVEFYNGSNLLGSDVSAPYTFNWNNLGVGVYNIFVKAIDDSNAVTTSSLVTIEVKPLVGCPIPTGLRANTITTSSALLSWNASENANSYVVWYRALGSTNWINSSVNGLSLFVSGLSANTSYEWTINAVCSSGNSGFFASPYPTFKTNAVVGCTSPQYVENGGYVAGSIVKNGSSRYQCKPWPFSGWCNGAAWAYGPGTGAHWTDAWVSLGACTVVAQAAKVEGSESMVLSAQPFQDEALIELYSGELINTVKVYDLNGREVSNISNISQTQVKIGKGLPNGIYVVNIQTEGGSIITRVFKGQ